MVRNRRPDPQAQSIGLFNWRDVGGLDAGIGLPVAIGIVGRLIHREIVDGGRRDREGAAELGKGLVYAQSHHHFNDIAAADIVGAAEGGDRHDLEEHVLEQREAQRLKLAGFLAEAAKAASNSRQPMARRGTLFILDEPTTGLDPNQLVEIRQLIRRVGSDKTVILSTHIMQEVQAMCDVVGFIRRGQLVREASIETFGPGKEDLEAAFRAATK